MENFKAFIINKSSISNLHNAIIFSKTSLFADDTNILNSSHSLKKIQKRMNKDLKRLFKWLCANKISLNVAKTEVIIYRSKNKKIDHELKLKLNGKVLHISEKVKYLGVILDCFLSWDHHVNHVSKKLSRANGAISKLRHMLPKTTLFSLYYALFASHLIYACQIWAQNINMNTNRVFKLQKCAVRLLSFSDFNAHSSPIFHEHNLLKLPDIVKIKNLELTHKILNKKSPTEMTNSINLLLHSEFYDTRSRTLKLLKRPKCKTTKYGLNSITYQSVIHWNDLQLHYSDIDLTSLSMINIKKAATKYFLNQYLA